MWNHKLPGRPLPAVRAGDQSGRELLGLRFGLRVADPLPGLQVEAGPDVQDVMADRVGYVPPELPPRQPRQDSDGPVDYGLLDATPEREEHNRQPQLGGQPPQIDRHFEAVPTPQPIRLGLRLHPGPPHFGRTSVLYYPCEPSSCQACLRGGGRARRASTNQPRRLPHARRAATMVGVDVWRFGTRPSRRRARRHSINRRGVAQSVARVVRDDEVVSSSLTTPTRPFERGHPNWAWPLIVSGA